jgi:hypothetical protein
MLDKLGLWNWEIMITPAAAAELAPSTAARDFQQDQP